MNFGLAAQSWHDNLPTHSVTVVLLSPLVSPSRLAVDHRHETSRLPLLSGFYSAPYGRTNDMVMDMPLVNMRRKDVFMLPLCYRVGKLPPDLMGFFVIDFPRLKGLYQVVGEVVSLIQRLRQGKGKLNVRRFHRSSRKRTQAFSRPSCPGFGYSQGLCSTCF